MKRAVLVALVALLAGCGSKSPAAPSNPLSGNYRGTLNAASGVAQLSLSLSQTGGSLSGTYIANYTSLGVSVSGSLSGTANGSTITATLQPGDARLCPGNIVGQHSGATISGTYAAFNCTVADGGTFNVTRQ